VRVSVVIPTLEEAARIGERLDELAATPGIEEVIVVDGGSRDATVRVASGRPGVRVLTAPRGRAAQQNAGAAAARGAALLFLHADVSLPPDVARHVSLALADPAVVAGAFHTWTVPDPGRSRLAPLLHLADLRSRYSGLPYGDQAIFVRAVAFHAVGGFPDQPLMEDLELSRRLRRLGHLQIVPVSVRVSGRRFLSRPIFYFLAVNFFPALYALGVEPAVLRRWYGDPR
jgi:rSAM/selenodomain-associated transferase 2